MKTPKKSCRVTARRLFIYNKLSEHKNIVSRTHKKTFYLQFCMGTPQGNEIAGPTQNPKKNYRNIKSTNQNEIFPKKSMLSTLKV
jgi:hypothetical protein